MMGELVNVRFVGFNIEVPTSTEAVVESYYGLINKAGAKAIEEDAMVNSSIGNIYISGNIFARDVASTDTVRSHIGGLVANLGASDISGVISDINVHLENADLSVGMVAGRMYEEEKEVYIDSETTKKYTGKGSVSNLFIYGNIS